MNNISKEVLPCPSNTPTMKAIPLVPPPDHQNNSSKMLVHLIQKLVQLVKGKDDKGHLCYKTIFYYKTALDM